MFRDIGYLLASIVLLTIGISFIATFLVQNQLISASSDKSSLVTKPLNSEFSIISSNTSTNNLLSFTSEGIPNAQSVFDTQTINLTSYPVKSLVVLIVDEAHEPPESVQKHISGHNSYFIPTNLIVPQGVGLSFLDADAPWDTPHPHTIIITDGTGKLVFTTGKLKYTNSSKSVVLPIGNYTVTDTKYPWMKGTINILSKQLTSTKADMVVGGFYTTTNKVSNNKDNDGGVHVGWLDYYKTQFPMNGFQILSEYGFHYAKCSYCPGGYWPDLKSSNHTLLIYSTQQPLSEALSKLAKLIWNNVYI